MFCINVLLPSILPPPFLWSMDFNGFCISLLTLNSCNIHYAKSDFIRGEKTWMKSFFAHMLSPCLCWCTFKFNLVWTSIWSYKVSIFLSMDINFTETPTNIYYILYKSEQKNNIDSRNQNSTPIWCLVSCVIESLTLFWMVYTKLH